VLAAGALAALLLPGRLGMAQRPAPAGERAEPQAAPARP
jgi:hypothetical protein